MKVKSVFVVTGVLLALNFIFIPSSEISLVLSVIGMYFLGMGFGADNHSLLNRGLSQDVNGQLKETEDKNAKT